MIIQWRFHLSWMSRWEVWEGRISVCSGIKHISIEGASQSCSSGKTRVIRLMAGDFGILEEAPHLRSAMLFIQVVHKDLSRC